MRAADEVFDGLIIALPTPAAALLLSPIHADLARELEGIPHASSAVVCLGYRQHQLTRSLEAFGCVVPAVQRRRVLAISYSSQKYLGRAPDGCQLFRAFVGGALQHDLTSLPDTELLELARPSLPRFWEFKANRSFSIWCAGTKRCRSSTWGTVSD